MIFQTPWRPDAPPGPQYAVEFSLVLAGVHEPAVDGWAQGPVGEATFVAGVAAVRGSGWSVGFRYGSAEVVEVRTFQVGPP